MFNHLSIKSKLLILVLLPCIAFAAVFYKYNQGLYQEVKNTRSIDQRFELFYVIENLLNSSRDIQLAYAQGENPDFSHFQQQIKQLQAFNLTALQKSMPYWPALVFKDFIVEAEQQLELMHIDDLSHSEKIETFDGLINSGLRFINTLPVDIHNTVLRKQIHAYLQVLALQDSAFQEFMLYQQSYQFQQDINRLALQQLITQQQYMLDQYLNHYASEQEVEYLLASFEKPAFQAANHLRNTLLQTEHQQAYTLLSTQSLAELAQRNASIGQIIKRSKKNIRSLTTQLAQQQQQLYYQIIAFMLILIALLSVLCSRIIRRIDSSLSKISADLQKVEYEHDYNVEIEIEGCDEFSQLSQLLSQLIKERQRSETAMIAAREKAEQANLAKSQFLANMSHEIRTPMNAILGMSRLGLGTELTGQQRNYLEKIHYSGESLLGIINDILDFSKIEAGKFQIDNIEFELEPVFEHLANLTATMAQQKGLELIFDIQPQHRRLMGDPLRLGQILLNLVSNAIKFTQTGEVVVSMSNILNDDDKTELKFSVTDTGIGISEEQQSHLFEAFTQADNSTTRRFGGTGLGLVICKSLVEMMGGEISLKSEMNKGSSVSFNVLFTRVEAAPAEQALPPTIMPDFSVLFASNCKKSREIMSQRLKHYSSHVDTVKSGFAAIERLQNKHNSQHYDLVFIDNKLDDIDGISAAREIQQLSLSQPPAVILMTEFHQKASISASTGSEITGFLEKPITESDLFDVLIQQLHKNQTYTSKKSQNNWKIEKETTLIDAEILLVEDNLINQEIAIELLQQAGMKVTTADNGKQAISILEEKHFDAVLMDLQMPVMGGLEATELIRKKPRFYQLPIIAMTANTMASDKEKCIASGMNDHIGKPINPKDLFATLSKWIVGENPETPFNQVDSVEPLAPESAEEIDLPHHITALDMACALKHMQGKKALLQKVLLIFAEENCHDDEKILNALNNHEFDQAQMLIHTLKGLTATIGALPLHEYCKSLDAALKNQDESIYDELQHQISIHFKKLLQELLPWAESIKNKKTSVKNSHNEARICTSDILHMPITAGGVAHENLSPPLN